MQNLLSFAKLLQGFPRGNVFPARLTKGLQVAELNREGASAGIEQTGQGKRGTPAWPYL
jgi:hypothetical protein